MAVGSWYSDPELWKAIAGVAGQYLSSTQGNKPNSFHVQPETPEEKAYRLHSERLAGIPGVNGQMQPGSMPTYSYLAPQINQMLQNLSASSSSYQPLNRLDMNGKEIARQAVAPSPMSAAPLPWMPGAGSSAPPLGAGGGGGGMDRSGGTDGGGVLNLDWLPAGGDGFPMSPSSPQTDPNKEATLNPNNPTLYNPPGAGGPGSQGPPQGMSNADISQMQSIVKTYGKGVAEVVFGIFMANPMLGIKGAWDIYQARQRSQAPPPPPTGGSFTGGGGVVLP